MRNVRLRFAFAFLAAACGFPGAGFETAWGSAWLLPPGDGQVITYAAFSDSTRAFDAHGKLIPVPAYQKFELGTYLELGAGPQRYLKKINSYCRFKRLSRHPVVHMGGTHGTRNGATIPSPKDWRLLAQETCA